MQPIDRLENLVDRLAAIAFTLDEASRRLDMASVKFREAFDLYDRLAGDALTNSGVRPGGVASDIRRSALTAVALSEHGDYVKSVGRDVVTAVTREVRREAAKVARSVRGAGRKVTGNLLTAVERQKASNEAQARFEAMPVASYEDLSSMSHVYEERD